MGIKIIGFNLSPNTLKTLCALEELGIEYEYEQPEFSEIKSPEYLVKKNPYSKDIFYDAKRPNVVKWVKRLYESPAWKQVVAKHKIN
ncbi:6951_t:CDS:2 [Entrophospora sp. SA101]|nr:19342_t:CDS:2 [Entrophospora sp. SA101]CAJ0753029.1 21992_t:CDS:2 [Entrophospora sp. SA101]CAJ0761973.1 6951_t:CDS:2 [Entrophospora sp. SA101]